MEALFTAQKPSPIRWYQEPWLWLVIAGPAIVIVAAIYTAFLAYNGADKVIAPDYYKRGLAINKNIRLDRLAQDRNIIADMRIDGATAGITLHVAGAGNLPENLSVVISQAGNDATIETVHRATLTRSLPGIYHGKLEMPGVTGVPKKALWHVQLEAPDWRLTADWHNPADSDLRLKAGR